MADPFGDKDQGSGGASRRPAQTIDAVFDTDLEVLLWGIEREPDRDLVSLV